MIFTEPVAPLPTTNADEIPRGTGIAALDQVPARAAN
jgi:hypothetical protein